MRRRPGRLAASRPAALEVGLSIGLDSTPGAAAIKLARVALASVALPVLALGPKPAG